ncbi:MAG: tRNA pseudouridine(55) synthase TruB [Erythrobacter sp.]
MPHGWLILDKPPGLGSTQAVGAVKRVLRQGGYGKVKVGHGGTLDPLAEGVLPIALGEATKLAGRMLDATKIYDFTIRFGEETDTLDQSDILPALATIERAISSFIGDIEQVPPAYSAIKIDGRRAYDRARSGEAIDMPVRCVTIYGITLLATGAEQAQIRWATLRAHVSKGTYIRSLARDIALALGTLGHVTYLRRVKAGPFTEKQAISLDKLEEIAKGASLQDLLLPLEAGLDDIPALQLDPESAQAARQGRVLSGLPHGDGLHLALLGKVPVALMELVAGTARVVRGFNLPDVAE